MALPKIDVPIHSVDLPLSKKKVRFRPFLVKEEKILLIAMESKDEVTIIDSIKQIITNCILDKIDVDNLPITDLEYFFLHLRARSVGEIVELQYKCNNKVKPEGADEEKTCGNVVKIDLDVLKIKPESIEKHTNNILLSENLGVIMRYPNLSLVNVIKEGSEIESLLNVICKCIDSVYDGETVYHRKDISDEEMKDFVENLSQSQFLKMQEFFETVPRLKENVHFHCKKCGHEEDIVIEGLQNFFV
jgi:hypothetical protein